jgi:hypothetical protein
MHIVPTQCPRSAPYPPLILLEASSDHLLIKAHSWLFPNPAQINLVSQQLPNVVNPILHHRGALKTQPETINAHILWQTHGLQHLRAEHATVTNLDPPVESLVLSENLHRRLGVRVVGGFEAQARDTHTAEEVFEEALQTAERETEICNDTFDLVELGEMGGVDGFVAEDAVDGEVAGGAGVFG